MIFVRDKGRLCNNILQYGHLYAWGREHGRRTVSMRFAYKYKGFRICHTPYHHFWVYLLAKTAARFGWLPVADFGIDAPTDSTRMEALLLSHRHAVAEGWYARWYDLFLKYKSDIVSLFAFDDWVKTAPDRLLDSLPADGLKLGLHVRRGDYRTWHQGRYFYTDEQYIAQVRSFLDLHPGQRVQVLVCGNDPTLDADLYRHSLPAADISFPQGSPVEDLYLLSQCDYLLGAPSTFTLVASMYRDLPLCWITDAAVPVTEASFRRFDYLFQHIL